jgi:hypothetical protein
MPFISTLFSGVLFLAVVALAANKAGIWDHIPSKEKVATIGALVFFSCMVATGAYYALRKKKAVGVIHIGLLAAVAIYGIKTGSSILGDRSIMGGRGPDANPAAGIAYGVGFLYAALGCAAGICALGIAPGLFSSKKEEPNQPLQPTRPFGPRG